MGINIFKIFMWGGISSDICSEITFYCLRVAVKLDFRPYIRRYTSQNQNFEYSYPLTSGHDKLFLCSMYKHESLFIGLFIVDGA